MTGPLQHNLPPQPRRDFRAELRHALGVYADLGDFRVPVDMAALIRQTLRERWHESDEPCPFHYRRDPVNPDVGDDRFYLVLEELP